MSQAVKSWFNLDPGDNRIDRLFTDYQPADCDNAYKALGYKMERTRKILLAGDWDVLLNIEDDIVVPPDALVRLIEAGYSVTAALFHLCPGRSGGIKYAARVLDPDGPQDSDDRHLEDGRDFTPGDIVPVTATGLGCILIAREVLNLVQFDDRGDSGFAQQCNLAKIPMVCHTGVYCDHLYEPETVPDEPESDSRPRVGSDLQGGNTR